MKQRNNTPSQLFFKNCGLDALATYQTLLADCTVTDIIAQNQLLIQASLSIQHQTFLCADTEFALTGTAIIKYVCQDDAQFDHIYAILSQNALIMQPISTTAYHKKYVWLTDQFGIDWQLHVNF